MFKVLKKKYFRELKTIYLQILIVFIIANSKPEKFTTNIKEVVLSEIFLQILSLKIGQVFLYIKSAFQIQLTNVPKLSSLKKHIS